MALLYDRVTMPRRHEYSQHFLRSPRTVAMLIGHSTLKKGDTVLDIGAGSGVIASVLARRVKRVVAIEPEPGALAKLKQHLGSSDNVTIANQSFADTVLPADPYKVFANIPFSESSRIVWRLTHDKHPPRAIYLIVQKQFANKLLPESRGFSSQLGMMIAPWWQVRIRYRLQKYDFTPPPAVDTVLIELLPRESSLVPFEHRGEYEAMIEANFTTPAVFAEHGYAPGIKPSSLNATDWARLYSGRK